MAKVIGLFQKHALLSRGVEGVNFLSTVPVDTVWYAKEWICSIRFSMTQF